MISKTKCDDDIVRYYIVQHTPDLMRREPRNVGVVVQRGRESHARFFGERDEGTLDGRSIRCFSRPEVYREWVKYWRRALKKCSVDLVHELTRPNGDHFNVVDAGFLTGTHSDRLEEVCHFAYCMLVSDGGITEALGRSVQESQALESLRNEMTSEFRHYGLLGGSRQLFMHNPILTNQHYLGKSKRTHTVSFAQQNHKLTIMEPVNFATAQKQAARDRAGYTAHVFEDLKRVKGDKLQPLAVIRCTEEDRQQEIVQYSLGLLEDQCEVIDWGDKDRREQFIAERLVAGNAT